MEKRKAELRHFLLTRRVYPAIKMVEAEVETLKDTALQVAGNIVATEPVPSATIDTEVEKFVGVLLSINDELIGATYAFLNGLSGRNVPLPKEVNAREQYEKMLAVLPMTPEETERRASEKRGPMESFGVEVQVIDVGELIRRLTSNIKPNPGREN